MRVVQHVVGDGAEDGAAQRAEPARPHHDQRHVLALRDVAQLVPSLTLLLVELVVHLKLITLFRELLSFKIVWTTRKRGECCFLLGGTSTSANQ